MSEHEIHMFIDGDAWCAVRGNFVNLQESAAGFGDTADAAVLDLLGHGRDLAAAKERVAALEAERDRLRAWLDRIEGGDVPCEDATTLRRWAWEAGMGREVSDG